MMLMMQGQPFLLLLLLAPEQRRGEVHRSAHQVVEAQADHRWVALRLGLQRWLLLLAGRKLKLLLLHLRLLRGLLPPPLGLRERPASDGWSHVSRVDVSVDVRVRPWRVLLGHHDGARGLIGPAGELLLAPRVVPAQCHLVVAREALDARARLATAGKST